MSYQLVQSEGGDLVSVDISPSLELLPTTMAIDENGTARECSNKFLADLHKFMQDGVETFEGRDHDDESSEDSDDGDTCVEEDVKDDGESFDSLKTFLRDLSERISKAANLLEEEAVQGDALAIVRELSEQVRTIAEGDDEMNHAGLIADLKALLGKLGKLLCMVRPVDLDLLLQLLQAGKDAGDTMQDKDVLLFIGQSGSGKTSLIHYLGGSTFKRVTVKGSYHLKVVNVAHPNLKNAATSSSTRSVTRSVQAIDITTESGEKLAICDSPGFDDTDGVEIDIANGFGLVTAIHRAKRVKPVLVLSAQGIGDRFGAVSQVLRTISGLVVASTDPAPFAYAFTKYEEEYATLLHKQFKQKFKEMTAAERGDASFCAFVRDIRHKTKPVANIVSPLNEASRVPLLSSLSEGDWFDNPLDSFSYLVSDSSLDKLKLQLQLTVTSIRKALDRKDASFVMAKLSLLVEIGNLLPDAAIFARQGIDDVSAFLKRCTESLSSYIEKCTKLGDHADAFKQELGSAKEIIETIVAFRHVSEKWTSIGSHFCTKSTVALTNCFEERVFSCRDNHADFISGLRQQHQVAITDLSRLKDIADTFNSLSHVFPRTVQLYQECSDALVTSIVIVVKDLHEDVTGGLSCNDDGADQFMPDSFLRAVEADVELFSLIDALKANGIFIGKSLEHFTELWKKTIAAFVSNIENKFDGVIKDLLLDRDLEAMVGMDREATADVKRVLDFLIDHPSLSSRLRKMNTDIATQKMHELRSGIISYVLCLVDRVEAEFSRAKEEENDTRLREVAQSLAKADKICSFCRNIFHELLPQCDDQGKRLAVLGKSLDDHLKKLTDKQLSMLKQAKHYLHVIESQNPTSILADIAVAWDEWEVILAQAPKKEKPGMVKRFFSKIGLASNESPSEDSNFVCQLKVIKIKIGQGLRKRLERACPTIKAPSSMLFLVVVLSMETRGTALIDWLFNPPNIYMQNGLVRLYTNAQVQLMRYLESFSLEKSIKAEDFDALRHTLDELKESAMTWKHIKETAQRVDPKTDSQRKLCSSLLAFEDYSIQRQYLASYIISMHSSLENISFLDEPRADSINEYDRNGLYHEVASSLSVFKGMQILQGHLSSDVDIPSLWKASLEHVETQIQNINKHLTKLMATFPNVEADFQRLYIWRSNFHSIEGCFSTAEPKIASIARRFRDDIDREMDLALKKTKLPRDIRELVSVLLLLKKSSIGISCWRPNINQAIDELLLSMSNMAPNSGRFILSVELELKNVGSINKAVALQILSEHNCFDGAMNAVFNSATARQGIEYVIDTIDLSADMKDVLRSMYTEFQQQYKDLIERGLLASNSDTMPPYLQKLIKEANAISVDYSINYRSQLIRLTAFIFAYWSLKSINSFVMGAMSDKNPGNAAIDYLMKPHAAQVVSIWCLLNFEHEQYQNLNNHLVEILTGEGKSIALGVTAIILAMMNCDVVCVCYSAYLSSRDYEAFSSMFDDFGVLTSIKYSTVRDACNKLYNGGIDARSLSGDIAWGRAIKKHSDLENKKERAQVLLIDEVDVFFKPDFYGEIYRACQSLQHQSIEDIITFVWANRHTLNPSSLSVSPTTQACIDLFPKDIQPIISKHISLMLRDAKNIESHDYIVCDGDICYKEFDGFASHWTFDYLTTFAAIKEYENGNVTRKAMKDRLCIYLNCGQSSYAEIPNMFDIILGVTGTLRSLSRNEKDILSHQYGIHKMTYIPSVYGKNKLLFAGDNPRDVIIADDDANFHLELRSEIATRRKPDKAGSPVRAVMVFFESRVELEAFYESEQMLDIKSATRVVTEEIAPRDKEGVFLQATSSGAITLMIREFGRGTDFKCFDARMLDGGGIHVIQAFFSAEIAEEIQIKGRTARQGARGSYSMVIHANILKKNMGLVSADVDSMRLQSKFYSYLHSKRLSAYATMCNERKTVVEDAEICHYETVHYKHCVMNDKRKDAIEYLKKWNDVAFVAPAFGTPRSAVTKASFFAKKRERIFEHQEIERSKRAGARSENSSPPFIDDIPEETMDEDEILGNAPTPMMIEDSTHYEVLGVPLNADIREIERAFRRACPRYHPDKNDASNARDSFERLTKAKEVLSCPVSRRAYDASLLPTAE